MKKQDGERDTSFLGKFILLNRRCFEYIKGLRIPQRIVAYQKRVAGYNGNEDPAEARLSFIFGMCRLVSAALLVLFVASALVFGGNAISYDKIYYMFRDIGYINSFTESRPETLNYSRPFENQDFTTFKNGLAVAGDGEIKLFTSTGRATMVHGSGYTNPKICASDTTVLVYDQGRRSFTVFNSFVSLYSETLDYPISSADMAPDGSFCIVTSSDKYSSVVRIYDSDFQLESEIMKNDYVVSAEMSPDSRTVAILSLSAVEGESKTTLSVVEKGRSQERSRIVINDVMPYTASFVSSGRIAVICADSSYAYDLDGHRLGSYNYPSKLVNMSVSSGGALLLFADKSVNAGYILQVVGESGGVISSFKLTGQVIDIERSGSYAFVLFDNEIRRIDVLFGTSSSFEFTEEDARLVAFSDGTLMACTDPVAYYISFN